MTAILLMLMLAGITGVCVFMMKFADHQAGIAARAAQTWAVPVPHPIQPTPVELRWGIIDDRQLARHINDVSS